MKSCKICGRMMVPEWIRCEFCGSAEFADVAEPYDNNFLWDDCPAGDDCTVCAHNRGVIERLKIQVDYLVRRQCSCDTHNDKRHCQAADEDTAQGRHTMNTMFGLIDSAKIREIMAEQLDKIFRNEQDIHHISAVVSKLVAKALLGPDNIKGNLLTEELQKLEQIAKNDMPERNKHKDFHSPRKNKDKDFPRPICPHCNAPMNRWCNASGIIESFHCPNCRHAEKFCVDCGYTIKFYENGPVMMRDCKCGVTAQVRK